MTYRSTGLKKTVLASLFIAIAILLPFVTGQIKIIGKMLLPMHFPVILCGFICGWQYGLVVGILSPILRSAMFGMPVMFPSAVAMAAELGMYGLVSGLMWSKFRNKGIGGIYISLITAQLSGRFVWGIVQTVIATDGAFTFELFVAGAFAEALPGIAIQLVFIPIIINRIMKGKTQWIS